MKITAKKSKAIQRFLIEQKVNKTDLLKSILINIRNTDKSGHFKVNVGGYKITMKQQG